MSLINQMLQDLDSRRAANGPGSRLPNEVRPLPAARRSPWPLIAALGVALALPLGWFVWQQSDLRGVQEPPLALPAAPPPVADGVAAPAVFPVAAVPPPDADVSLKNDATDLRLTTSLHFLPERESSPAVRTTRPEASRAAPSSGVNSAASANAPPMVSAPVIQPVKAIGPMTIEKSQAAGSPHERADGEYRKAIGALNAGRSVEAVESLHAALKHEATHTASRQLLFKLLVESKRLEETAQLLQDGLHLQPAQISWAMSLARLQVDRADLPGAWQTLQRSLPFAADSADFQGFAAHVLQRLGRGKEAAAYYQAATRLAPGESRWWLGLGLALEGDGRAAEAREAFLRAKAGATLSGELATLVEQKLR